jgi:hypothetical protein
MGDEPSWHFVLDPPSIPEPRPIHPLLAVAIGIGGIWALGKVMNIFYPPAERQNPVTSLKASEIHNINEALEHIDMAKRAAASGKMDEAWLHGEEAKLHAKLIPQPYQSTILAAVGEVAAG